MLLKNLKVLMVEDDNLQSDTTEENKPTPLKRKPQAASQVSRDASDGIGNEAYTISNDIVDTINTSLRSMGYDIIKIYNNKNSIFLEFKVAKDGMVLLNHAKDKSTGIPSETLYDVIQQLITAALQKDINKFTLNGPIRTSGNGDSKLMIAVNPNSN